MTTLKDRIDSYQNISDFKLLNKLPIIICINGKSSSKNTSLLDKPYCKTYSDCFYSTMLQLCQEVEGVFFGYSFNDEIVLLLRNDQTLETKPWFDNKIQKIVSIISSITSICFNKYSINLINPQLFTTQIFNVPNITEAINAVIFKQQGNSYISLQFACFYELLNKGYDKNKIKDLLVDLSTDEKVELLKQECNINFVDYPLSFRRGVACYRNLTMNNNFIKNKWKIDKDLPIFTQDHNFLQNIFK